MSPTTNHTHSQQHNHLAWSSSHSAATQLYIKHGSVRIHPRVCWYAYMWRYRSWWRSIDSSSSTAIIVAECITALTLAKLADNYLYKRNSPNLNKYVCRNLHITKLNRCKLRLCQIYWKFNQWNHSERISWPKLMLSMSWTVTGSSGGMRLSFTYVCNTQAPRKKRKKCNRRTFSQTTYLNKSDCIYVYVMHFILFHSHGIILRRPIHLLPSVNLSWRMKWNKIQLHAVFY